MFRKFKQIFLCLLVMAAVLLNFGCSPKKIRDAVEQAARANRLVKNLVKVTEESFDEKKIDAPTADKATKIFDKAIPLADKVTDAAENLKKRFPSGKIPPSELKTLRETFDAFRAPVEDVLEIFGALSPSQRTMLDAAIEAIKAAIDLIESAFSQGAIFYKEKRQWT